MRPAPRDLEQLRRRACRPVDPAVRQVSRMAEVSPALLWHGRLGVWCGEATGRRSGAVCGLRSGAAVREDAELVPPGSARTTQLTSPWPTSACRAPRSSRRRTCWSCSLSVGRGRGGACSDGLGLGHLREGRRRWHRAKVVLAFRRRRGTNGDDSVVFVLDLVGKDRTPEPGETVGIGTVDRELGGLAGHVRTSRSRSGSANGHVLMAVFDGEGDCRPRW